jgi:phosphoribosylglycinamide formyltransferase-1
MNARRDAPRARAPLRLALLISGRGSNMSAVARACREGRINARPSVVIADRADAGGLAIANSLGIKTAAVARNVYPDRAAFEHALDESLLNAGFDLIVLAGFMRILSPEFTARHAGRTLNIHPSLLPNYRGLHTHRRVLDAGDTVHGASVHFVTEELDGGPVVLQSRVPVRSGDTEEMLAARVLQTEHVIYPKTIGWLADGRLQWREGRAWLDGEPLNAPVVESFDAKG